MSISPIFLKSQLIYRDIHFKKETDSKNLFEFPERAHYEEENAEGPIKRLLSAVDLNGPSGFLRMYAEYRVALESATKVVKEFENPKITKQENIEFSMNGDNTESLNKNSEEYQLATDMAMFMADKLNEHGIKTVVVPEKEAKKVLEESYKKDIRQRLSVALRTMQPEGFIFPANCQYKRKGIKNIRICKLK